MGSTSVVGASGRSKVTFTLLVMELSLVVTLVKCLTGTKGVVGWCDGAV